MSVPVRVGDVVEGKYRVERVLGAGGMGVVVAARHLALRERVAIKFLLESRSASPDAVARFLREGRAAARIRSEHVARTYDVGTLPTGVPYMVMEYLAGRDLGAVIRADGPLAITTAVDYVIQAALGLAVAHARGIVHRDLKPTNLFLTRGADGLPVIKIIDFGISKDLRGNAAEAGSHVTQSSVVMGSPAYMSPEQMRSARDVDARSDVWALGAILFCLLTGEPPYPGESIPEIHESILAGPPSLSAARPEAPPELEAVIQRCLQRDPAARPEDVAALASALAPFGPPHASASAERVSRILTTGAITDDTAPPPDESTAAAAPEATEVSRDGSWAPEREISLTSAGGVETAGARAAASGAPTDAARDTRSRAWRTVVTVIAASAAGAAITLAVRPPSQPAPARDERAPAVSQAISVPTTTPTAEASASPAAAPPLPTVAPSATAAASSAPSASASPQAARRPSAPRPAASPASPPPRAPPSPPRAGKRDPLADPD